MERTSFAGWPDCVRLANRAIELIVTTAVGPRVIVCGRPGGPNLFATFPDQLGRTGGDEWRIYGGHRLWHAPEAKPRTYAPDNEPVAVAVVDGWVRFTPPIERENRIQKEIDLRLLGEAPAAEVLHRLINRGPWPVTLAPWALSVMRPGGVAVAPWPSRPTPDQLLPNRALILWPYTDPADPRLRLGSRYLRIAQDAAASRPLKVGLTADDGWAGYAVDGFLFLKRFEYRDGAPYPDLGSAFACYTAAAFLELETLGPLVTLAPGEAAEHREQWFLFDGADARDDEAIDRTIRPRVSEAQAIAAAGGPPR